jgi:hypothetical protein
MIFFLLAWLIPFIIVLIILFTVEDDNVTVRDALQLGGLGLIPLVNWILVYILIVEIIKDSDKIQEFLNKKLK